MWRVLRSTVNLRFGSASCFFKPLHEVLVSLILFQNYDRQYNTKILPNMTARALFCEWSMKQKSDWQNWVYGNGFTSSDWLASVSGPWPLSLCHLHSSTEHGCTPCPVLCPVSLCINMYEDRLVSSLSLLLRNFYQSFNWLFSLP